MRYMLVTLEVSKASGWLNADALCRESNGGHAVRGEGVRASRRGQQCPACSGGSTADWGQNTGVERTRNICSMFVTPEVSQLEMSALKSVNP